jgi:uncharacterized membrane protein YgcG
VSTQERNQDLALAVAYLEGLAKVHREAGRLPAAAECERHAAAVLEFARVAENTSRALGGGGGDALYFGSSGGGGGGGGGV